MTYSYMLKKLDGRRPISQKTSLFSEYNITHIIMVNDKRNNIMTARKLFNYVVISDCIPTFLLFRNYV